VQGNGGLLYMIQLQVTTKNVVHCKAGNMYMYTHSYMSVSTKIILIFFIAIAT